jgi:hypothetical protein
VRSIVETQYHGLVLQAQKRWTNGLLFNAHYTLSKATDNGQNSTTFISGFSSLYDPRDLALEEGYSSLDRRHRFVASFNYAPSWLYGFQLAAIGTFESGLPQIANISGGVAATTGGTDTSTTNGSGGSIRVPFIERNSDRQSGRKTIDARLSKAFKAGGNRQLVLLWEAFNVLNSTNYTVFGATKYRVASSSYNAANNLVTVNLTEDTGFLVPTQASSTLFGPRDMQLGIKFLW